MHMDERRKRNEEISGRIFRVFDMKNKGIGCGILTVIAVAGKKGIQALFFLTRKKSSAYMKMEKMSLRII